ncbi:hypothetical protein TorRG33x02_207600 [Trema orientale]|uniref:Harbinger transposase-derived protein n=1 Tax=Trema orientale TaxID=63057 RepID=A0A2P5ED77_TREOI|nr:hypothetical protein TorRG33x02_207600 [Trema orientale]
MNFIPGGPSYYSSSASSFFDGENEDDNKLMYDLEAVEREEEVVSRWVSNNNNHINNFLNLQNQQVTHGGLIPGHIVVNRDREVTDQNLFNDYFAENPRFNESMFRRRFKMSHSLFLHIINVVQGNDNYFLQRKDGLGRLGLSDFQKITAVFRMLAYGVPVDTTDEYIKIGESTAI